jgi:hypothetical protein
MKIDHTKPIEELVGDNYGIVKMRLGNVHCMTSVLSQARLVRPQNIHLAPVALRRGWVLCVLECIAENRSGFVACTTLRQLPEITAFS